ncbi:hypothetical protein, partial [Staphylococcus pasteuri]|uniref:hypothetical protein n=1 Tax=Staphylococcus pasteuri TaxID=45972 RepID=UPI001649AC8D
VDGVNDIDEGDTNGEVDEGEENGRGGIKNIEEEMVKKGDGGNEINEHYNDKLCEINEREDGRSEEKGGGIELLE